MSESESNFRETAHKSRALKFAFDAARTLVLGAVVMGGAQEARAQQAPTGPESIVGERQAGDLDRLEKKEAWLKARLGRYYSPVPEESSRRDGNARAEGSEIQRPMISDIRGADGEITHEQLQKLIDDTYPKGWVNNRVVLIEQKESLTEIEAEKEEKFREELHLAKSQETMAAFNCDADNSNCRLTLYPAGRKSSITSLIEDDIAHEALGHGNDWETGSDMSAEDRADLLHGILERLNAPDRFKSSYVESIRIASGKQEEEYVKAKEYYAEIVRQFFKNAEQLPVTDHNIVKWRLEQTDPGFNWREAKTRRDALISESLRHNRDASRSQRR